MNTRSFFASYHWLMKKLETIPIDHSIEETTGTGYGLIVKFKTFYLKIYDNGGLQLDISAWLYDEPNNPVDSHVFQLTIPNDHIDEFFKQLTEDNYLRQQFKVTWPIYGSGWKQSTRSIDNEYESD